MGPMGKACWFRGVGHLGLGLGFRLRILGWWKGQGPLTRFLSNPFIIRVPFFLMFSFNKGTLNQKGQKGTTQEPS